MAAPHRPVDGSENYFSATIATLADCQLVPSKACTPWPGYDRRDAPALRPLARAGTHDHTAECTADDEYQVTVTLKVRSCDLEDLVARTFADPHCVDVSVRSTASTAPSLPRGDFPPM